MYEKGTHDISISEQCSSHQPIYMLSVAYNMLVLVNNGYLDQTVRMHKLIWIYIVYKSQLVHCPMHRLNHSMEAGVTVDDPYCEVIM